MLLIMQHSMQLRGLSQTLCAVIEIDMADQGTPSEVTPSTETNKTTKFDDMRPEKLREQNIELTAIQTITSTWTSVQHFI